MINDLRQKNYIINELEIENKDLYLITISDKIVILKLFKDDENIDSIVEDASILSGKLNSDDFIKLYTISSDKDNEKKILDLRAILWDVYIIGVHWLTDNKDKFKKEDVSRIERNRLIARKIILEDCNLKKISMKIQEILEPTKKLKSIIINNKGINEEDLFKELTTSDDGKYLKNTELKSFEDMNKYLNKIIKEVKNNDKEV
ncbi:hypothetical protein I6U48_00875 [Clostridium sp. PL3]|uniref:Uncharacterized protein n=1 Tax=Clostridium thailandense TaxID=2794346 RepID=A0A949X2K9_9CLOT|nr:hypothetical protein [Clostridium thailandense]MBV7271473.1 hypothetical protein [Clostridium thailandense]